MERILIHCPVCEKDHAYRFCAFEEDLRSDLRSAPIAGTVFSKAKEILRFIGTYKNLNKQSNELEGQHLRKSYILVCPKENKNFIAIVIQSHWFEGEFVPIE